MTKKKNETGYQYYAFTRNSNIQNTLYLGTYKGSRVSNVLKSRSGQSVATSASTDGIGYMSLSDGTTGARACARRNDNGNGTGTHGYEEITWYAREYVNALYMMKYGNPDAQSIIGKGRSGGSPQQPVSTGGTDQYTNATFGDINNYQIQMKLFGLEDWWGNIYERLDGAWESSSSNLRTSTTGTLTNSSWSGSIFDTDVTLFGGGGSGSYIKSIVGNNTGMFSPYEKNSTSTEYYCDYFSSSYTNQAISAGGYYGGFGKCGPFCIDRTNADYVYLSQGSRLMYL